MNRRDFSAAVGLGAAGAFALGVAPLDGAAAAKTGRPPEKVDRAHRKAWAKEHFRGFENILMASFSPDLMQERLAAWERHYPWVDGEALAYFRARVPRARNDAHEALDFVLAHATTPEEQDRCLGAFVTKCQILWSILDAVQGASP